MVSRLVQLSGNILHVGVGTEGAERRSLIQSGVLIVQRPDGWEPKGSSDLPPNVEVVEIATLGEAVAYAEGFNAQEMKNPCGAWAVVPYSPTSRR